MRIATAWEQECAAAVQDVEQARPRQLARLRPAGPPARGAVQLATNGWAQAVRLGDLYRLYVVWNCATPDPILVRVRNLLANERVSATYAISPKSLMDAAEPT